MKNNKLMIILATGAFLFCSCGPTKIERKITSEPSYTTVTRASAVTELKDSSSVVETTTTTRKSVAAAVTETSSVETFALPEEIISETTTTAISEVVDPQTEAIIVEEEEVVAVEEENVTNEEEYVVFKPSTHYIHRSTCYWVTDECVRIENTNDIKARKCNECNPDMEIKHKYKEKEKKSSAPASNSDWNGPILTPSAGTVMGPSGKETYYNLDMSGVVSIMRNLGYDSKSYPYWVRDDGCKMLGDYIILAADLSTRPRGTILPTSLGMGIVCDTGGFAYSNPTQLDIATQW